MGSDPFVSFSKNFAGNPGARLGIGQSVMMILHTKPASLRHSIQFMVHQTRESPPRSAKSIVELIIRIIHLINPENRLQTTLIKSLIMSDKRQSFYERLNLSPNLRKHRSTVSILICEPMHLTAPIIIIIRLRLNQRIKTIHNLPVPHNHNTHRTNR